MRTLLLLALLATPAAAEWTAAPITRTADGREWWHDGSRWVEVTRTQCYGGQCQPGAIYYRPTQPQQQTPVAPAYQPRPFPDASNGVALLSWRDQMEKKILALEARANQPGARGPAGPPGPPGKDGSGTSIDADLLAVQITQAVTAQLEQRIAALEAAQNRPFHLRVSPDAPYQAVRPGQYVTLPLEKLQTQ